MFGAVVRARCRRRPRCKHLDILKREPGATAAIRCGAGHQYVDMGPGSSTSLGDPTATTSATRSPARTGAPTPRPSSTMPSIRSAPAGMATASRNPATSSGFEKEPAGVQRRGSRRTARRPRSSRAPAGSATRATSTVVSGPSCSRTRPRGLRCRRRRGRRGAARARREARHACACSRRRRHATTPGCGTAWRIRRRPFDVPAPEAGRGSFAGRIGSSIGTGSIKR